MSENWRRLGQLVKKCDKTRKNPYFQLSKCKILWRGASRGQNSIVINYGSKPKIQPLCLKNGGVWANLSKTRKNPGRIHTSSCRNVKSFGVVQVGDKTQLWLTMARNRKSNRYVWKSSPLPQEESRKNPYFQLSKRKILWRGARLGPYAILANCGSKWKIH